MDNAVDFYEDIERNILFGETYGDANKTYTNDVRFFLWRMNSELAIVRTITIGVMDVVSLMIRQAYQSIRNMLRNMVKYAFNKLWINTEDTYRRYSVEYTIYYTSE